LCVGKHHTKECHKKTAKSQGLCSSRRTAKNSKQRNKRKTENTLCENAKRFEQQDQYIYVQTDRSYAQAGRINNEEAQNVEEDEGTISPDIAEDNG
jgi:hypothetical protein